MSHLLLLSSLQFAQFEDDVAEGAGEEASDGPGEPSQLRAKDTAGMTS